MDLCLSLFLRFEPGKSDPTTNYSLNHPHMKKHLLLSLLIPAALMASAQGTAAQPEIVADGDITLPVDGRNAVTAYYSYTSADADRLVTILLPSPFAGVVASSTAGDKQSSDVPNVLLPDFTSETTAVKCLAPKDEPLYLKITFPALSFADDAVSATINVSSERYMINYGGSCSDPIQAGKQEVLLPLSAQVDPPFDMNPVYAGYTAPEAGWLYLRFQPSVTMVEYATDCASDFKRLKHEYITENGRTVGARAMMEVAGGDSFIFKVSGFNAVMMTAMVENPEPGTSCDFPIDITPGEVELPAAAGNYYWRITPAHEGYIEITSDASLTDGRVQVMMDCNGTGSFSVYNFLHLRTWVWDRMEYLIHIGKSAPTPGPEKFLVKLVEPQSYDDIGLAETLVPGTLYSTPDFAGEYYFRVIAPSESNQSLHLTTLTTPEDDYTRVNLYDPADMFASVAKGFDMIAPLEAGKEYLLKWTVFDVANPMEFKISYEDNSSVNTIAGQAVRIDTAAGMIIVEGEGVTATVTDMAGRIVVSHAEVNGRIRIAVEPGIYMVSAGTAVNKVIVR